MWMRKAIITNVARECSDVEMTHDLGKCKMSGHILIALAK